MWFQKPDGTLVNLGHALKIRLQPNRVGTFDNPATELPFSVVADMTAAGDFQEALFNGYTQEQCVDVMQAIASRLAPATATG